MLTHFLKTVSMQGGGVRRLPGRAPGPLTVFDIEALAELTGAPVVCDNHCFGCTAGAGSGCQGAPAAAEVAAAG
jgi:hypothetical protein